jgi:haloacetate dehalogenase
VWDGFHERHIDLPEVQLFVRWAGTGPPLLLLHGFPQTHLMWRDVARHLVDRFTVVCPDLRGYGASSCPGSAADHAPYAKRAFARDALQLMSALGHRRFAVVGHDRGGRVAYRLALDTPEAVTRLVLLDIVPTASAWDLADARFALAYWPWSFLAQAAPLPERLIASSPEALVEEALSGWGTPTSTFPPPVREAYIAQLRDPDHCHAICEEYRAAASLDRDHDRADLALGRKIACPVLVLWGRGGPLDTWYQELGGPLGIWRSWTTQVEGRPVSGGHFFPEEHPDATAEAIEDFCLG